MPALKPTCGAPPCNSIDSSISEAIEEKALAAAALVRASGRLEALLAARMNTPSAPTALADLDEHAAAEIVQTTLTTFRRAKVEADYFVGTRPRWRDAESVRTKFATRGKAPTTPATTAKPSAKGEDLGVDQLLSSAGLRRTR